MTVFSQQPPLETGVSQTLAKWRAANYSDVRYKLNITLEKGAPLMKGNVEIRVTLTGEGAKNDLILDWRTTQFQNDKDKPFANVIAVNEKLMSESTDGSVFDYQTNKEHLVISQKFLKAGENVIKIEFASPIKTSGAGVTRYIDKEDGGEYIYSLFVPSDASTAFPCFDQPDLKARFKLSVSTMPSWKVISNTNLKVLTVFSDIKPEGKRPSTNWEFEETKPISTYVFAFAAGDFEEFADTKAPVKMVTRKTEPGSPMLGAVGATDNSDESVTIDKVPPRIYVRKSQAEKFKPHADEVFRLNREAVKYLENYFDYKFPFPKYDFVLIPEFPFGGMEHAGAIFLRESSIIFPTEPTKNDYISRATLIFHETAHQWFGDTVTMKWFDDLWLKEGFAEFMAYKTLEKVMPQYNAWKIFYERNKQAAYLTDSTKGTTPIYQEIPNLSAAKSAYGNIVYRKAPSFLRQAEFYLGEDKFQIAVRAFLKKHEFANATWQDLVKEFEEVRISDIRENDYMYRTLSDTDKKRIEPTYSETIKNWANDWVKNPGLEIFRVVSSADKDSNLVLSLRIRNSFDRTSYNPQKFNVLLTSTKGEKGTQLFDLTANTSSLSFKLPKEKKDELAYFFPNYQDYGYGIFLLDDKSRDYVLANIQNEKDDFLRAMMWGSLWDSVRETELAPKEYVALVIKNINVESDESTIQTLLGRVSIAMNYYLSDAQRAELAPQIEKLLIDKIQNAPTAGQRITYYRAFLNIASTENSHAVLKMILNGYLGISGGNTQMRPGLVIDKAGKKTYAAAPVIELKPKDRFDIVTRLLILGDKDAPELLANLEKYQAGDDAKRYAYAAKAGIGTAENKAKFWNDFTNNKEISESWIESAFVPFNSVRHSELTLAYLEKALAELPNLKKNRKIFFVNGWLSAFIGGQKSEQALAIVNKFLADNPNLDKDLRLKILENVDGLERAVKIRSKYSQNN